MEGRHHRRHAMDWIASVRNEMANGGRLITEGAVERMTLRDARQVPASEVATWSRGDQGGAVSGAGTLRAAEGGAIPPALAIATLFSSFTARLPSAPAAYSFCSSVPSRASATSGSMPPGMELRVCEGCRRGCEGWS